MMITFLAIAILVGSLLLVLGNLRMVAVDTIDAIATAASRARATGVLTQRLSFVTLWAMIFGLSYF